jgi:predicted transcriptional regulator
VDVVTTDHNLEEVASQASGQLAKHRWHWTLDESNPGRVNFSEYARQVGRSERTIRAHANGYAEYLDDTPSEGAPSKPLAQHVERAGMSADTHAAAEAVAQVRGMSASGARTHRREEVKRVRNIAQDRAEKHGTTVEDEASKVAQQIKVQEDADARLARERQARLGLRYVKVENMLAGIYRKGQEALNEMRDVPWEDEQRELLIASLANIKAILGLIDVALSGAADVDWDAEMEKLS